MSLVLMKRVHDKRTRAEIQIRSIMDAAAEEKRELTGEEESQIDALDAESRSLSTQLTELMESEQRNRDLEQALGGFTPADTPVDKRAADADAISKVIRGEARGADFAVTDLQTRDLTKTATSGLETVPQGFYNQLVDYLIEVSGILSAGPTVLRTSGGENIPIPTATVHATGALTSEAPGTITESTPTTGSVTLNAYKYASFVQVSSELLQDEAVDLLGYLAMSMGRAIGNAFGVHAITGTGTNQPGGAATGATTGVTGGTGVTGAFTADNLIDLMFSVIGPYRNSPSCAWLMRDSSIAAVRKLKDSQQRYLWEPSMQLGRPDNLLGKPLLFDPNVAAVALSAKSVLFGDFSRYFVRYAGPLRFERSDEFAFQNDLASFRAIVRMDGKLSDTSAIKAFVGGAT